MTIARHVHGVGIDSSVVLDGLCCGQDTNEASENKVTIKITKLSTRTVGGSASGNVAFADLPQLRPTTCSTGATNNGDVIARTEIVQARRAARCQSFIFIRRSIVMKTGCTQKKAPLAKE